MFYAEGASLLLSGVGEARIPQRGGQFVFCCADNPVNEAHANRALALIGSLDVAVVANRYVKRASLLNSTAEMFDETIEQNLSHAWCAARAAAGKIGKEGRGVILFISSIHGEKPSASAPLYSVACGGVNMIVAEAAQDFGRLNIRANQLRCGPIDGDEKIFVGELSETYHDAAGRMPRGYLGSAEEVAAAALFLCSDAASFINGATLTADGGFLGYYLHGDSPKRWDYGYAAKGSGA